ncbi:hypothetical protein LINGRAHAP2_LOCUS9996 [Linum grandiflorum]
MDFNRSLFPIPILWDGLLFGLIPICWSCSPPLLYKMPMWLNSLTKMCPTIISRLPIVLSGVSSGPCPRHCIM